MLTVNHLSVTYDNEKNVVDDVSFSLSPSENVALIGSNGAGKTSLLLSLVGILPNSGGDITVNDIALHKKTLRHLRSLIGFVFQDPDDQLFMPNVFEDAAFGPRSYGCDDKEVTKRVADVLSALGISHLAQRSPLKLSGGEKRLCAIATVLTMQPDYLLFDEPTAFLDPRARRMLAEIISELPQGKLIATHDLAFAEKTCRRAILIQNGKIIADGSIRLLHDEALLEQAGL